MPINVPEFNAEKHEYYVDGKSVPGVTQLLGALYDLSGIPNAVLEFARERGSAVHKACELWDLGTLDEDSVDTTVQPYLDAWKKFVFETGFETEYIEQRLSSTNHMLYAGTLDRAGRMTKLKDNRQQKAVIDIKAVAKVAPVTGVQLAAYENLLLNNNYVSTLRYAVQLLPNGTYKLHEFYGTQDWGCFVAQYTTYQWRKLHNV